MNPETVFLDANIFMYAAPLKYMSQVETPTS
jgi:hypothetical protein